MDQNQQPTLSPKSKKVKRQKTVLMQILLIAGLILVLIGMAQAIFDPANQLNLFIFPGMALMLLAALMPGKKVELVEGNVLEEKK